MTFRNKQRNVSNYEDGSKPYISSKSYVEQRRVPTRFTQGESMPESELAQPYLNDGPYEEMEYYAVPPVGIDFEFDSPALDGNWDVTFMAWPKKCLKRGKTTQIYIKSTHPITKIEVKFPSKAVIKQIQGRRLRIFLPENDPKTYVPLDVHMVTPQNSVGVPAGITGVSRTNAHICDDVCVVDPSMAWDGVTSAETVARNNSCTVAVTGNNGPFAWSVSGTGFTLDNATTVGLSNTLNADGSACGSATITVTGCDDTVVTGYVRCTTGTWNLKSNTCGLSGTGTFLSQSGWSFFYELISGNKKQYQASYRNAGGGVGCGPAVTSYCNSQCTNDPICDTCENCIDPTHEFPFWCDESAYQCWCIDYLNYYEWECS